jgi:hypothetical protein
VFRLTSPGRAVSDPAIQLYTQCSGGYTLAVCTVEPGSASSQRLQLRRKEVVTKLVNKRIGRNIVL